MYKTKIQINDDEIKYNYVSFRKKSDTVLPETDNKWKGSIGAFLGDSITEGVNTSEGKIYWNYLSEMLDLSLAEPYGLAGSCISSASDMGTDIAPFVTRYKEIRKDADFNSCNEHNYELGLVLCHDGKIYPELFTNHQNAVNNS